MKRDERGQGLVEYALILVLVAIVVIAVLLLIGPDIDRVFCQIVAGLGANVQEDCEAPSWPASTSSVSEACVMNGSRQSADELEDVEESIVALWEEAEAQEESLREGAELAVEAVGEGLEVLMEFAEDAGNQALAAALSQLVQEVKAGNVDAVPGAIAAIGDELEELPLEIWVPMSEKMAPRLVASCDMVTGGPVSQDTITLAVQAVEQLDDDHPGKMEALQGLEEARLIIEDRNIAIELFLGFQSEVLGMMVNGLELAGEYGLAAQLDEDSAACGN